MLKMQEKMQPARCCQQFNHVTSTPDCVNQRHQPPEQDVVIKYIRITIGSLFQLGISVEEKPPCPHFVSLFQRRFIAARHMVDQSGASQDEPNI